MSSMFSMTASSEKREPYCVVCTLRETASDGTDGVGGPSRWFLQTPEDEIVVSP